MRVDNPSMTEKRLWVPRALKNRQELIEDRYKKKSKFFYITHVLISLSEFSAGYRDHHFVPVYSQQLRKVVGNSYKKYLDYLIESGIIKKGKNHDTSRSSSTHYALTEEFRGDYTFWRCRDEALINRLREWNEENRGSRLFYQSFPYTHVRKSLEKTSIQKGNALYHVQNNEELRESQKRSRIDVINELNKKSHTLTVNQTNGRIQTPVCNLPSELRQFLEIEGYNSLVSYDITNSQPFVLSVLYSQLNTSSTPTPYVSYPDKHITASERGEYYEVIAEDLDISREDAKALTFEVFFSQPHQYEERKRRFAQVFPNAYDFCLEYKRENGYNQLAIELQKKESEMMLECLRELGKRDIPVLSVYDSIIIPEEFSVEGKRILTESFSTEDIEPSVH